MSKYLKHLLIFFPLIQFVLEISLCVYMNFFCCYSQFDFFFLHLHSTLLYSTLLSFGIFHFIRCVRLPLWPIVVWWFGFILALLQPFTFHCESRQMVSYWIQFNGWLMCMCFRQYWLRPNQIFRRFNECHTNRFVYVLCACTMCRAVLWKLTRGNFWCKFNSICFFICLFVCAGVVDLQSWISILRLRTFQFSKWFRFFFARKYPQRIYFELFFCYCGDNIFSRIVKVCYFNRISGHCTRFH